MRKLAIAVPIAMVAGFVVYEAASQDQSDATTLQVIDVPAVNVVQTVSQAPHVTVVPPVHSVPLVPAVEVAAQQAQLAELTTQLADLAVTIPAIEIDAEALTNLTVHASAKADIAAAVEGFVELIEQQNYNDLSEEQIVELTGSLLADIAANLEAYLKIETKEGKLRVVGDTGGGR
jgi:hypothetical protein